jgi:hypothetical protein
VIFIASPIYQGASPVFLDTLIRLTQVMVSQKIPHVFHFEVGDSNIDHARNTCAKRFTDAIAPDVLLFIDSDMGANPHDLLKIVELARKKQCVVGLPCPVRNRPGVLCLESSLGLGVLPNSGDELIEVLATGTGIMAIPFTVLNLPVPTYADDDGRMVWQYFACEVKDGKFRGEDWTFCQRVRESGKRVYVLNPNRMREKIKHEN